MIWAPDLDDFSGKFCHRGPYPLVTTIVNVIRNPFGKINTSTVSRKATNNSANYSTVSMTKLILPSSSLNLTFAKSSLAILSSVNSSK